MATTLETRLWIQIKAMHGDCQLPIPEHEYYFHPDRKWRADYCWPYHKLIVEVEGGIWRAGRHNRPKGFIKDCEKYNTAVLMGYKVIRVTSEHIHNGQAIQWICKALGY